MPHNHSPRCCCEPQYDGAIVTSAKPCPSCIEHGELAMLGDNTNRSAQNPAINVPPVTTRSEFIGQMVAAAAAAQPAECPSCHAVGDQPHTDYCQLPLTDALRLANAQTSQSAATTSQPATHTRGTPRAGTCPSCYLDTDDTPALNCNRPDYHDRPGPLTTHLR